MKKIIYLFSFIGLLAIASQEVFCESFSFAQPDEQHILVSNRILAKINGKAISVVDLMKKMDMLFYRQFPEYTSSIQARYQFYQANWKHMLHEMIDKELILADASENKLQVSGGDVRQEMESLFGPNIINNLDKVGLSFEEAYKMVQSDIVIRRMMYIRVHAKAMRQVTPQLIRDYYEEFAKDNIRDNEWHYQVVSIRDNEATKSAEMANLVYQLLSQDKVSISELPQKVKEHAPPDNKAIVNISEEFKHKEKELSEAFKEIISKQSSGTYSKPLPQKSRVNNAFLFRIFHLKEMKPGGIIPFNEIENQLKEKLIEKAIDKETETYLMKLHQHFNVQENQINEMIQDDFEPFSLK